MLRFSGDLWVSSHPAGQHNSHRPGHIGPGHVWPGATVCQRHNNDERDVSLQRDWTMDAGSSELRRYLM